MPDRSVDALDRFWDSHITGEAISSPLIDPALEEAVRRLHTAEDVDRAEPAFISHLWEDLMNATSTAYPPVGPTPNTTGIAREQRESHPIIYLPELFRHRLSIFAAAAILLAALGGIAAYWLLDGGDSGRQTGAPAIFAPASPSPEPMPDDLLFDITVPADVIPPSGNGAAALVSIIAEPKSEGTWVGDTCCPGVLLLYVVDGTYMVRPDRGSITVYRAGMTGEPETITEGTDVELEPGDLLLTAKRTNLALSNPATTPVKLLTWDLLVGNYSSDPARLPLPSGWSREGRNADREFDLSLPREDARLTLQRVTLSGTETFPAPPGSLMQAVEADFHGNPRHTKLSDYSVASYENAPVTLYVLTFQPLGAGEGTGTPAP
jgi:hypothetical protein